MCKSPFGACPAPMLQVLVRWTLEDMHAVRQNLLVTNEDSKCEGLASDLQILLRPTRAFAHRYIWIGYKWMVVEPQADAVRM